MLSLLLLSLYFPSFASGISGQSITPLQHAAFAADDAGSKAEESGDGSAC